MSTGSVAPAMNHDAAREATPPDSTADTIRLLMGTKPHPFVTTPAQQTNGSANATYFAPMPAIAFTSRYSSKPKRPHSRPLPDCL